MTYNIKVGDVSSDHGSDDISKDCHSSLLPFHVMHTQNQKEMKE